MTKILIKSLRLLISQLYITPEVFINTSKQHPFFLLISHTFSIPISGSFQPNAFLNIFYGLVIRTTMTCRFRPYAPIISTICIILLSAHQQALCFHILQTIAQSAIVFV
ncbi:hypothetical protein ABW53_09050 [Stutzerimonas stutzeri]|nr:hypothetical protein ABW53_09050 [Stutzerimonas stutzeri]